MIKASASITLAHQIDIVAIYWFYLLQSSTSAAPSAPTAAQATAFINNGTLPGNWKLAEPAYTEGSTNSLYVVELTKYSDNTGSWSSVSLSSSYEAAKTAYNKALQAGQTASAYLTEVTDDGVFVHENNTAGMVPTDTGANGVHISDDVDIIRNGQVVSQFGETVVLGRTDSTKQNVTVDPSQGLVVKRGDTEISKIRFAADDHFGGLIIENTINDSYLFMSSDGVSFRGPSFDTSGYDGNQHHFRTFFSMPATTVGAGSNSGFNRMVIHFSEQWNDSGGGFHWDDIVHYFDRSGLTVEGDATLSGQLYVKGGTSLVDYIYPVGSIYMSVNSTSPATLFGGSWERIQDRFLLAAGSSYSAGSTGGEASVKLTDAQMAHGHGFTQPKIPNHQHNMGGAIWSDGSGSGAAYVMSSNRKTTTRNTTSSGGGGSCTGGAVSDLSGAASTRTAHNNMPPYLAVYVWKRTA